MEEYNYYRIRVKCGHVGRGKYCLKDFYFCAKSKSEARERVINAPRVKRQLGDEAIEGIWRITKEKYLEGKKEFQNDPYFRCQNNDDMKRYKAAGYKLRTYHLNHGKNYR